MRDNTAPISSSKLGCHSLGASTTPSIELNSPAATLRMRSIPSNSPERSAGRVWQPA